MGDPQRPFTPEWAAAFRDAIEADAGYRQTAAGWTWPVAFVLDAAPEYGYPDAVAMQLELERGRCHAAALLAPDAITAPVVLRAAYAVWKSVVRGELDPVVAVTGGKFRVSAGAMTLMLHPRAATALVACARAVPTLFPDEA
ncbi:MAG TPA: hypothetical protein PK788_03985 [Gemmatimonadaceae bacterium]|nr:hypothetical protein [Gemmatimonadaceae bacterium]HRQ77076.1 hypothetical protein [Gemmatimonadaceae bacterium]